MGHSKASYGTFFQLKSALLCSRTRLSPELQCSRLGCWTSIRGYSVLVDISVTAMHGDSKSLGNVFTMLKEHVSCAHICKNHKQTKTS